MDTKTSLQAQNLPAPVSCTHGGASPQRCKKRRGRFLPAFFLFASAIWLGWWHCGRSVPILFALETPWPIPSDGTVYHCAEWSGNGDSDALEDFPYSADASFELPVSADTLFLISRSIRRSGTFSTGHVDYVQSEEVSDSVTVDVTAYFWLDEYLAASKACLVEREGDQAGVGIFTNWKREGPRQPHEQAFADVSNVEFNWLALNASIGGIHAESLSTGNASIHTSFGPIKLESLVAESADIGTSMGSVEGTFNASNKLIIRTSNAPITVDINLSNNADKSTEVEMYTSNGAIEGNITLESDSERSAFDTTASTSNGRIQLAVVTAPIDSTVRLNARTSIGAVGLKLPDTFEGSFIAATSLSSLSVKLDETVKDPTGAGRERRLEYKQWNGWWADGRIGWSEEGMGHGGVELRTSMAPIMLQF
ncbi:hypothetical protein C8R44DRAFT_974229 [Mycena epipterygia]|nr:hypothetical protein C8R44DRAFT_974229 [Mycena epipterygia]